jgi:predicted acylesterase/phospholipase RssA
VDLLAETEDFVHDHRPHGTLTGDATDPAWKGYLLTVWVALKTAPCCCGNTIALRVSPARVPDTTRSSEEVRPSIMKQRLGLVLEGGGAKGAYAFGWLMEFAARGVKFDAVAGTSVGALNALLWATNQIGLGEQLWRTISEQTTIAIRRPRWLWSILILPYALHRLLAEKITNINDKAILGYTALFVAGFTVVLIVWPVTEIVRQTVLWGATLVSPPAGLGHYTRQALRFFQIWLVLCCGLITMVALMAPSAAHRLVQFSWRSSVPLRKRIEEVLHSASIRVPTYVATAEYREVCDPQEELRFFRGKVAPRGFWAGYDRYVPVYVAMHEIPEDRRASFVLASASLPYGITLPVDDGDRLLVDGGVIDNSPVLPLISKEQCERIVIIKLRRSSVQTGAEYAETFRRLERLRLAAKLTPDEASRMRARGETLTIDEPASWPDLVTVIPTRPLGTLLSSQESGGTSSSTFREFCAMLRFEPDYVDRLIALGRADAAARSPEFWRRLGV